MVSATVVNYYVKLLISAALLGYVIRNVYKTIDGSKKGKRIFTPAMGVIYFLFGSGSIMAIVMIVLEREITNNQGVDNCSSNADIHQLILISYIL
jgi:hypothetical protein